ncbi:Collagen Alpha-5(Vi) Chain [Manis pentadactyla]|nr:Collagen Alpha-5(Vi) Chain [Manis pentadactyla]
MARTLACPTPSFQAPARGAGRRARHGRPAHREPSLPPPGHTGRKRRGGDGGPPLRSAAACDVTRSDASGEGPEALSWVVAPLTLGGELAGQRCKPIAVSPLEAARLGWRLRRLQLQPPTLKPAFEGRTKTTPSAGLRRCRNPWLPASC